MEMETSDSSSKVTTASSTTSDTEKLSEDLQNLHEMIDLLSSVIHTLNDDVIRLSSESLQEAQPLEMADKLLSTIKISIEESNNVLSAMNTNLMFLEQDLSSLKLNYEDHQVTSYDGTLIWKITRFQEKMSKNIR
jgi:chromosome segregation ATPase